jgi:hypothetical protein
MMTRAFNVKLGLTLSVCWQGAAGAQTFPDLGTIPKDLETPPMVSAAPAAGLRVRQTAPGYEDTEVHHALYLPTNWQPHRLHPVIVEYAGNGNYTNRYGDVSHGVVEGSNIGYGISGGSNYIWVCMPFVKSADGRKENAAVWWGDVKETVAYCTNTVGFICRTYGGDPRAVVLAGFSRGAIACNYIGLRDDGIARLWRAFICHSHYDGVITTWGYAEADRASALKRLQRLSGRPQFICHEGSVDATRNYLAGTGVSAPFTFRAIPFRNHSDQWTLRDIPARRAVRQWLREIGL